MLMAHLVSIGSESLCKLKPDYEDGYVAFLFEVELFSYQIDFLATFFAASTAS